MTIDKIPWSRNERRVVGAFGFGVWCCFRGVGAKKRYLQTEHGTAVDVGDMTSPLSSDHGGWSLA